ncbi:hypothetical protein G2912_26160 [Paraburkholderia aspalathi]|nr:MULTISPECIES: hypothetical protein [Paraburkholderia]MBK3813849.1 hypothetical protein [Paraburkholderia aspalathi]
MQLFEMENVMSDSIGEVNRNVVHFERKSREAQAAHVEAIKRHEDALGERESGAYKLFTDAAARLDALYAQIDQQEELVRDSEIQFRTGAQNSSDDTFRKLEGLLSTKREAEEKLQILRAMLDPVERNLVELCLAASDAIDKVNQTTSALEKARSEDAAYGVLARFGAELEQAISVGGYQIIRNALDAMPGAADQSAEARERVALRGFVLSREDVDSISLGGRVPGSQAVLIRKLLQGDTRVVEMLLTSNRRLFSPIADRALRGICERALNPAAA